MKAAFSIACAVVMQLLAACGDVQVAQLEAQEKCLSLFETLTDEKHPTPDGDVAEGIGSFRFVSTGQFITELSWPVAGDRPRTKLTCTGDFNARTITSVQFNGQLRRPGKAGEWRF